MIGWGHYQHLWVFVGMHLPALDRFLAVVKAGSLSKAAEQLHISQPALTKSIQTLEERLGADLFVRAARGVSLTSYGKALLLRARLIDAEMRRISEDIESLRELGSGSVNVGAPLGAGVNTNILPAVTLRLADGARKVSVNYSMGTREHLLPLLRQGGLDVAIAILVEDETTTDLIQEPLFDDRNCVVVRDGHPLLARQPADIAKVLACPWLVLNDAIALERALRVKAHLHGLAPWRSIVHSDSAQLLKIAIQTSDAVGLMRYGVCLADIQAGELRELQPDLDPDALGRHTLGLIYRRDAELSAASREVISEIRAECSRYP
jgi:DNA-binding transcriptional LysR family regulator